MIIPLTKDTPQPLYIQVYLQLKQWIIDGTLPHHAALPSKRQLAIENKISINTVMNAYDQLLTEGYIYSKERKGYFVATIDYQMVPISSNSTATAADNTNTSYQIDWSNSHVDGAIFPHKLLKKIYQQLLDNDWHSLIQSSPTQGDRALRNALQGYLTLSRGVPTNANQLILGPSSKYLLSILLRVLPGLRVVGVENPGYHQYFPLLTSHNIAIVPLPLDDEGLIVPQSQNETIELIIVTPNHQFPTGRFMPLERRQQLLHWAYAKPNRWIIEDDYDSEYKYAGIPIPSLTQLDTQHRVIYMSSLSRTLASGYRVSFAAIPQQLVPFYKQVAPQLSPSLNSITEKALTMFIHNQHLEKHLNRSRIFYKRKRDTLMNAIYHLDKNAEITGYEAGLHILYRPSLTFNYQALMAKTRAERIKLTVLADYTIDPSDEHYQTLFLSYSHISLDSIGSEFTRLWKIIKDCPL
ncbi:PLP-dependent aminotransferase family protein [Aerococcaceae bacterium zg-BR22]|uniref:MocR-like pyridoxine biosynthesis transcription factor PdxR n=1 Tax=Aerococcaceae bacterium zg-1292 TaxID=2774330 RepID=UPI00406345C6|nr:PLP-dependent aminotransferase family protein [Aerococcaceae bacterium zg-BR22]